MKLALWTVPVLAHAFATRGGQALAYLALATRPDRGWWAAGAAVLTCYLGAWRAIAATAGLFVLVHWPNWVWMGRPPMALADASASILVQGLVLGFLRERTGSLWPCIATHVLYNALVSLASDG